jgi:hypothetical protein
MKSLSLKTHGCLLILIFIIFEQGPFSSMTTVDNQVGGGVAATYCIDYCVVTCYSLGNSRGIIRLANNQLSGAQRSQIELIDFLFRPSNCLYRFNSCLVGLAADFELRIKLIVSNSGHHPITFQLRTCQVAGCAHPTRT